MQAIHEVCVEGWCVRLDRSGQVLTLDIPEGSGVRNDLSPTLPLDDSGFISAAALLKAKQFDDGLYAAVELAAQEGAGTFPGKAKLLTNLAGALTAAPAAVPDATARVLAACRLGGIPVQMPEALQADVQAMLDAFFADETRSKPLGFYTWSAALTAIFRQDRLLQTSMPARTAIALRQALETNSESVATYAAYLALLARLTNPLTRPHPENPGERWALFPPSRSHEVDLFQQLYGDRLIPDGFDLMTELIRRIRARSIAVPTDRSGWYDHQTWALAALLTPDRAAEGKHLRLGQRYRRYLEDLFRGALALTRETHVKQGGCGRGGYAGPTQPPIYISPDIRIEPLPTLYPRRSASYRFVRSVLEESFGPAALVQMRRLTPAGPSPIPLADELASIESLFTGASCTACEELGLSAGTPDAGPQASAHFAQWCDNLAADPDLKQDARMMVPVFYDVARRKTKVWAFLGWRSVALDIDFAAPPRVVSCQPENRPHSRAEPPLIEFTSCSRQLAVPVMAEVYVDRLLDRDEFRRHCDRQRSRAAILANLR